MATSLQWKVNTNRALSNLGYAIDNAPSEVAYPLIDVLQAIQQSLTAIVNEIRESED